MGYSLVLFFSDFSNNLLSEIGVRFFSNLLDFSAYSDISQGTCLNLLPQPYSVPCPAEMEQLQLYVSLVCVSASSLVSDPVHRLLHGNPWQHISKTAFDTLSSTLTV